MERNYIPFVAREVLTLNSGEAAALSVVQAVIANTAPGAKIEYQDISFVFDDSLTQSTNPDSVFVRYGFEERGYLLEELLNVVNTINAPTIVGGLGGGWRFPKPYKLLPGQQMRAEYSIVEAQGIAGYASIMLPCKREDNGEPYILHGTNMNANQYQGAFVGDTMAAPADTALLVEGIQGATDDRRAMKLQVYNGNGTEIVKIKANNNTLFSEQQLYDPLTWTRFTNGIELGKFNGWYLPAKHPLILELVNNGDTDYEVLVTVRGSAEVGI